MMLHIPEVLSREQVADIRAALEAASWEDGTISAGGQAAQVKHNRQLSDQDLAGMVSTALKVHPLFMSAALPYIVLTPHFNAYDSGGHYGNHVDSAIHFDSAKQISVRTDISCTVFLNNPEDYDGGELIVEDTYGAHEVKLNAGDAILYPSTSLHRVEPVTRGLRLASFLWVQSLVRDDHRRQMLFDLDMTIVRLRGQVGDTAEIVSLTAPLSQSSKAVGADMKPALTTIPREIVCLSDYEAYAFDRLDGNAWVYLMSGAGDELTLEDNMTAYRRYKLAGHVLGDVTGGHTRVEIFGRTHPHPIFLAPIAYQKLFHPDGETATAMAAGAVGAGMVVSSLASTRFEDIAAQTSGPLWLQLYMQPDRATTLDLVRRAEALGFQALMVTVDAPLAGLRNREQRAGFALPEGISAVNMPITKPPLATITAGQSLVFDSLMHRAPTFADIGWLTAQTKLPVLLKGILTPEDALKALDHGAAGICVSNHGGRILDTLPATLDALPAIAAAVDGRLPILIDGGIRRGSDAFKALALGASAVMIGRPYVHALATAGALGVSHAIRTLHEELEVTMALSGCATLSDITRKCLAN